MVSLPQKSAEKIVENPASSETMVETKNLSREIQKTIKSIEYKDVQKNLNELAKKILGKEDQKLVEKVLARGEFDKALKVFQNETLLKKFNADLEKYKKDLDSLKKFSQKFGGGNSRLFDNFDDMVDEFTERDAKGKVRMRKMGDIVKDSFTQNIREKGYVKGFFSGTWEAFKKALLYSKLEKHKGLLVLYPEAKETSLKLTSQAKNVGQKIVDAKNTVKSINSPLHESPQTKLFVKNLETRFRERMKILLCSGKQVDVQTFARDMRSATLDITSEGLKKGGKPFLEAVSQNKFPGLTIKTTGKFMAVEVLSRGLLDAIRSGDIGNFPGTLANSNIWVEAIPGVGSYKSMERLFSDNGDPLWLKVFDAGVNVLGDGILIAGIAGSVFSGGATAVAGVAAKAGIQTSSRGIIKALGVRGATKEVAKTFGKNIVSGKGKTTLLKSGTKFAFSTVKTTGIVTLTVYAMEEIFKAVFPNQKISEVALDMTLTPEQQKFVKNLQQFQESQKIENS